MRVLAIKQNAVQMDNDNQLLFVYGTLMNPAERLRFSMANRYAATARRASWPERPMVSPH